MKTRHIPENSKELKASEVNAVAYTYTNPSGKLCAIGYSGKRTKPDFVYSFVSEDARLARLNKWRADLKAQKDAKEERAELAKHAASEATGLVNVGDIFSCSWGYDQTNVDFYKVIRKKGQFVTIQEIGTKSVDGSGGFMADQCVPDPDSIKGEPFRKKIQAYKSNGGKLNISLKIESYAYARPWDGEPEYRSWYA